MQSAEESHEPRLDKARHVKYWTRCLKTLLPHHYTGNESNRMYLAFMIISALDILDAWSTVAKESEKKEYVDWIYHCQHPNGGFRMWPGTNFDERASEANAKWDPANVPATYFALAALLAIGDDLTRVKRKGALQWLVKMQRPDGSFGETLVNGQIEGGRDPRFGYCAAGVRYILRGDSEGTLNIDGTSVQDIDINKLVGCISLAESYDGGIADEPFHEPHAGYTFCSLGCLKFVNRLRTPDGDTSHSQPTAPRDPHMTLRWLTERQTDLSDPDAELEEADNDPVSQTHEQAPKPTTTSQSTPPLHQSPDKTTLLSPFGLEPTPLDAAGMNGRTNKVADTCYAWWVCASFSILQQPNLWDHSALQKYLLDKTQHPALGGFGKFPGDLPDLYHSCLGLAALGLTGLEGIKEVDGMMCISKDASERLPALWKSW
ncbi:hypothetical protein M409DRAFT_71431 [Zasmidium cellare ATCC 36951]|uniref:Prenyltransferase alpha-alpha toroid domain-containing protein n=1 Tax=Zasmidium cellare ATCC 36951 TaxID=1080233 RepID=A0A6A6BVQ5_ZASCE|nr:uncharacterized protein M409DRAFT_71431 [Zasmidium cellare ATCC 36951]KAF2158887.1 hypothetical protein M409DRAFT_71431 [Zasmidium cellare ATCC 36951]